MFSPLAQINHHYSGVEITGHSVSESGGEERVRPEIGGEVVAEIGVTVFGGAEDFGIKVDFPELGNVVDDDEVGIEVDDADE